MQTRISDIRPLLTDDLKEFGLFVLEWILGPVGLVTPLVLVIYFTFVNVSDLRQRWQNFSALAVGFLLATVFIVYDRRGQLTEFNRLKEGFSIALVVLGFLIVVCWLLLADKFFSSRTTSFFAMPIAFASPCSVYLYFANDAYRDAFLAICLGLLVGAAVYVWWWPTVIDDLLGNRQGASTRRRLSTR